MLLSGYLTFFLFEKFQSGKPFFLLPEHGRRDGIHQMLISKIILFLIECCRAHATNICGWFFLKIWVEFVLIVFFYRTTRHTTLFHVLEKGGPSKQRRKTQQQFLFPPIVSLSFFLVPPPLIAHGSGKKPETTMKLFFFFFSGPLESKYVARATYLLRFPKFRSRRSRKKIAPLIYFLGDGSHHRP